MTSFTNLGDLIPRDRDLGKVAIVDLAGGVTREILRDTNVPVLMAH